MPDSPADRWCEAVAALPSVAGALAVDTSRRQAEGCVFLFVVLRAGGTLDGALRAEIYRRAADSGSVPDAVYAVPALPCSADGHRADAAVRRLLAGDSPALVATQEQIANVESLGYFAFLFNNL